MPSDSPYRYTHCSPQPGTKDYEQGKSQGALNLERYHYLRALILGQYKFLDNIPPDRSRPSGQIFPRQGLDFSPYTDFALEAVTGVKLHPRKDGTLLPADVENYHELIESNYRASEGGILDAVLRNERVFFNIMLNYHSKAKTTGNAEWDAYFAKLRADGFPKKDIQCMVSSLCLLRALQFLSLTEN